MRALSWMDAFLRRSEAIALYVGAFSLAALFALTLLEVAMRNLFNAPILGMVDYIEWILPIAAMAGIAAAQVGGEHFRMEILINTLKGSARWLAEAFGSLLAAAFSTIVAIYSGFGFVRSWSSGDVSSDIELPLWPPKLLLTIVLGLLSLRLVLQSVGFLRLAFDPNSDPVCVPKNALNRSPVEVEDE